MGGGGWGRRAEPNATSVWIRSKRLWIVTFVKERRPPRFGVIAFNGPRRQVLARDEVDGNTADGALEISLALDDAAYSLFNERTGGREVYDPAIHPDRPTLGDLLAQLGSSWLMKWTMKAQDAGATFARMRRIISCWEDKYPEDEGPGEIIPRTHVVDRPRWAKDLGF